MKPKVAILGTGIAGAFAYRACYDYKLRKIDVFSHESGKPGIGAFYLHWVPEDIQEKVEAQTVMYIGIGKEKIYLLRQWPHLIHNPALRQKTETSFPKEGVRPKKGWNAKDVIELLWLRARIDTVAFKLSDGDIKDLCRTYDIVFHSFPSQVAVASQPVNAIIPVVLYPKGMNILTGKLEEIAQGCKNVIVYNGKEDNSHWVRASSLFGSTSIEYPYSLEEAHIAVHQGGVLKTIPDIFPGVMPYRDRIAPNAIPIGRWATYRRDYLSHMAYKQVWNAISRFDQGHKL